MPRELLAFYKINMSRYQIIKVTTCKAGVTYIAYHVQYRCYLLFGLIKYWHTISVRSDKNTARKSMIHHAYEKAAATVSKEVLDPSEYAKESKV
jgi:hypothetical protein